MREDSRVGATTMFGLVVLVGIGTLVGTNLDLVAGAPASGGRPPPVSERCTRDQGVTKADVDGDGRRDLVYHDSLGGRALLGVCTANGTEDRVPGAGMTEVLKLIDVQGDGRYEIFYGGTTSVAEGAFIAVFRGGHLRRVTLDDGRPLVVAAGREPGFLVRSDRPTKASYGCEDTDGDGSEELVQVVVRRDGEGFHWVKRAYAIDGARAKQVSVHSGTADSEELDWITGTESLVSPCEIRG